MVVISELPGGSNGGDPNKNLQEEEEGEENLQEVQGQIQDENPQEEEEIQNENPQEEEENQEVQGQIQNENLQEEEEEENLPIAQELVLPYDLIESIVTVIPRCYHKDLSQVSRGFRHVLNSPGLFQMRIVRGFTEPVLYALIGFPPFISPRWFILRWRNSPLGLSRINSLPPMFPGSASVTIGHNIYVMGGYFIPHQPLSTVIVIDCRFHTWEYLPNMQRARCYAAAGVVDGRIYVIGGRKKRDGDWVEVFDVGTRVWETLPSRCPRDASESGVFDRYVVMQERVYMWDRLCCLAYEPRQNRWQSLGVASQLRRLWHWSSCVVGDLLYALDVTYSLGYPIVVYYPNELVWRPVRSSASILFWPVLSYDWSRMMNVCDKLVILGGFYKGWVNEIWCVEIALETRQGQIWMNVESTSLVLTSVNWPSIDLFRSVTL